MPRNKSHFFLTGHGTRERYTSPNQGSSGSRFPYRNNSTHAAFLETAFAQAVADGTTIITQRNPDIQGGEPGFYLEFELPAQYADNADRLENKQGKKHIELLAVHPSADADKIIATVWCNYWRVSSISRATCSSKAKNYMYGCYRAG